MAEETPWQSVVPKRLGKPRRPSRWPWVLALLLVGAGLILIWQLNGGELLPPAAPPATPPAAPREAPSAGQPGQTVALSGEAAESAGSPATPAADGQAARGRIGDEQAERKKPYGLDKSLDAVVKSDEYIKVGDQTIPVAELERKLVVEQRGKVLEKPLGQPGQVSYWGIYVVRPGDNLWGIHFRLLKEYLASKGVALAADADRPTPGGYSSGVGKVLKFAEHMVGVYNLQTGAMSHDLNLLEPGRKVVVYNLTEVFEQLAKIDPRDLSGVMYDGRVLFFPQKQPAEAAPRAN